MTLVRYDLGDKGKKRIAEELHQGHALSKRLSGLLRQREGRAFTILPEGLSFDEVYKFDDCLKEYDYPSNRAAHTLDLMSRYDSIDIILHALIQESRVNPDLMLWTEDFLARRGDPLKLGRFTRVCYLEDTVTYITQSEALASASGRSIVQNLRTMPVWTGTMVDNDKQFFLDQSSLDSPALAALLEGVRLIFSSSYRMDGFIFYEISQ